MATSRAMNKHSSIAAFAKSSILVLIIIHITLIAHAVPEDTSNRNTCLVFDGVDDYVEVSDGIGFNFGAGDSFTVVVRAKSGTNNRVLLDKGREASPYVGYAIGYGTEESNRITFELGDGVNTSTATSTTRLEGNELLYIVGVRNASARKVRIYINDILEDEQDDLTGDLSNTQILSIGSNSKQNVGTFFKGYVCDVRIYNRALSMNEVIWIYTGNYSNTNGLVLWLKMDEGVGEICADSSGEGNNGTIVGASWLTPPESTPTPTPTPTPTQTPTSTPSPKSTSTPSPESTPTPTPNPIAVVGVAIILIMIILYSYYSLK